MKPKNPTKPHILLAMTACFGQQWVFPLFRTYHPILRLLLSAASNFSW
jgi:hypothetical protein